MRQKIDSRIPRYSVLLNPTFLVIKSLGGSATNNEILDQIIETLHIPDDIADIPHQGNERLTELSYQLAWARTYLRIAGVITNSARSVWVITPNFLDKDGIDEKSILRAINSRKKGGSTNQAADENPSPEDTSAANDEIEYPEEAKPWKTRLAEILQAMNPYGFERLAQRILRECGFTQVEVTKKSGDGGIDGTGKLKINGIFSFNVAFQCKRYSGIVGASAIRDFRGSLTTDIEKGVLITTGTFSKQAREEASNPGKQQIDLIDGEELIQKIAEFGIGVRPVTIYEVDEDFFSKI